MKASMETKVPDNKPTTGDVWMRGLFMLLFIIGCNIGVWLLNFLAIVQFLWLLFDAPSRNASLQRVTKHQIVPGIIKSFLPSPNIRQLQVAGHTV